MSDQRAGGQGFSATDAAFEGFQIVRRDPMSILAWSLLSLVFSAVVAVMMVAMGGSALSQITAQRTVVGQPPPDPMHTFALMAQLAPVYGLIFLLSLGLYGVLYAAVNRAVLRPGKSFGHLGFGRDELLQVGLLLLIWLILFGVYIGGFILVAVVGAAATAVSKPLGIAAFVIGAPLVLALVIFFMVRLSLVSPLALDRKRLAIGEAWRLTRGRFWPLLGAYALSFITVTILVIVVFSIVGAVAMTVAGPAGMASIMRPDMTSVASYFGVVQIVNLLVSSAFYGLFFAVLLGAPASAYAQLSRGARVADVFGPDASERSTAFGTAT